MGEREPNRTQPSSLDAVMAMGRALRPAVRGSNGGFLKVRALTSRLHCICTGVGTLDGAGSKGEQRLAHHHWKREAAFGTCCRAPGELGQAWQPLTLSPLLPRSPGFPGTPCKEITGLRPKKAVGHSLWKGGCFRWDSPLCFFKKRQIRTLQA